MAAYEWVAVAYFVGLSLAAPLTVAPWRRRVAISLGCLGIAVAIASIAAGGGDIVRAWAPHVYLVAGYWLPALLAVQPSAATRFERWLVRSDIHLRQALRPVPPALAHITELAYLLCYPVVPIAFAALWMRGTDVDITRFWVAVLVSGYACYGSLPWLVSRPPRLCVPGATATNQVAAINVFVLGRVSHGLNTFPSGHVAVACAAAAMLAAVSPAMSAIVGVIAVGIAIGAVAGRYHYVVDVLFGFIVALVAVVVGMGL
jgi:membrane-associated phospholipid phosphatase